MKLTIAPAHKANTRAERPVVLTASPQAVIIGAPSGSVWSRIIRGIPNTIVGTIKPPMSGNLNLLGSLFTA